MINNKTDFTQLESITIALSGVNKAAALYYQETSSIVLFIETSHINPPTKEKILSYLSTALPATLLPSKIISLIKLPLTATNEINKPELNSLIKNYIHPYMAPTGIFQTEVVRIWSEVLNKNNISIHDNFFELGGSKKKAMLATTMIEQSFNVKIPYGYFYQAQTTYQFAKAIETNNFTKPKWLSTINQGNSRPIYWLLNGASTLRKYLPDDQTIYTINTHYDFTKENYDSDILKEVNKKLTVESICAEFVAEIMAINQGQHCIVGGFSMGSTFACEIARQLKNQGLAVDLLVLLDPLEKLDKSVDKLLIWRFKRWLKSLYYFHTGVIPPNNFSDDYVLQAYRFLKKKYDYPKYNGKVLLMQKIMNISPDKRNWLKIADTNNLLFYTLDTKEHLDIVKDKRIQMQWVNKIRELIY